MTFLSDSFSKRKSIYLLVVIFFSIAVSVVVISVVLVVSYNEESYLPKLHTLSFSLSRSKNEEKLNNKCINSGIFGFGVNGYKCTGSCFCEQSEITTGDRKTSSATVLRKGLVHLFTALTIVVAYEKAKKHFQKDCEMILSSDCPSSNIRSDVECDDENDVEEFFKKIPKPNVDDEEEWESGDYSQEFDRPVFTKKFIERIDENSEELKKKNVPEYFCKGVCSVAPKHKRDPYLSDAEKLCGTLKLESKVWAGDMEFDEDDGVEMSFWVMETVEHRYAKWKFQDEVLDPYCEKNSIKHYDFEYFDKKTNKLVSKRQREVSLCAGRPRKQKKSNPTVRCEKKDWHEMMEKQREIFGCELELDD